MKDLLFLFLVSSFLYGCSDSTVKSILTGSSSEPVRLTGYSQHSFRVRSEFTAELNADQGWAGVLNENVRVFADEPFRIRFEVETTRGLVGPLQFSLQYRRNAGEWIDVEAHDFPHPESDEAATPRVSIVSCAAYLDGEPTKDLLSGSSAPFQAGTGLALAERTLAWTALEAHGEFEWALVVRRFADGAVTNDEGDTFELRMIETGGALLGSYKNPLLQLSIRPGHVGGTFVETPGRIGPWQATNGDLYFMMEPSETDNLFMMIKSTDEGITWREIDGANRPTTNDLEAVDSRLVSDTIHILHEVSQSVRYHAFRTSDNLSDPDSWAIGGELVANVEPAAQAVALEVRSDGSLVAFYAGPTKIHYSLRSPAGNWGKEAVIDASAAPNLASPQAVRGMNDTIHLTYYGTDGTIWYRRLLADDTLTARQLIAKGVGTSRAEYGAVLPLVYIPETDTVVIIYRLESGKLWERRIVKEQRPTDPIRVTDRDVVRNAVDSQQPGADAVPNGNTVHVSFIDQSSRSIFSTHDSGGWQTSTLQIDNILGSWIRGNVYSRSDGRKVYGFIYDAGSDGGAGMNRFREIVLSEK